MKSHFSLTDLSIAVLVFAGTVAMHQAARAETVYTGPLEALDQLLNKSPETRRAFFCAPD